MLLPPSLGISFTVDDARRVAVEYGRTRSADLVAPFHGVRSVAALAEPEGVEAKIRQLAFVYRPRLRVGQYFCESTALALHGVPLPWRESADVVHVGVTAPFGAPRTRHVRGHHYAAARIHLHNGLPVCDPVQAWVHCAARLSVDELIVIGDALMCRKNPLATAEQLASAVAAAAGGRGFGCLSEAFAQVRSRTDSPQESRVRLLVVRSGMPEPRVNVPIRGLRGEWIGLGDLVLIEWKIVIEYEGGYHFETPEQLRGDIDRLARFVDAGWTVIRLHKDHLRDPTAALRRIRNSLAAAGWRP